ncbi:hypothetical protein C8R43DRAFT_1142700 [Mycena crocata]|nr:hypothetical protein C8R43DRAFT_1142700 [Mycena crocata]
MDSFYDNQAAAELVELWATRMSQNDAPNPPDTIPALLVDVDKITTKVTDHGRTKKVMMPGEGSLRQEGIFTITGVLKKYELPPVKKSEMSSNRVKYARQHALLVAYNTTQFKKSLDIIQEVVYILGTSFSDGEMEPLMIEPESETHGHALATNCRYFTVGRNIPEGIKIGFHKYVDPAGVLAHYINEFTAHCLDNDVAYLELKQNKLITKDPQGFRAGDIVQVGFAVVAYRTQSKDDSPKYVCKLVMRTLTLLDTTLSKKAYTQRHAIAGPSNPTQTTGVSAMNPLGQKRKEMHETNDEDEDEVQEARKRFNRMRLIEDGAGSDNDMMKE